jgi:hypothetical protein
MSRRPAHVLMWSSVLLVLLVAAALMGIVLWGGAAKEMSNRAQVLGTLLAIAVIVPPVVSWAARHRRRAVTGTSTRTQVDAAADKLAEQTFETWSRQVVQRGIQAPTPVRVRWHWATDDIALPRQELKAGPSLVTDPSPLPSRSDDSPRAGQVLNSGLVTRLHDEVYARLQHGRLALVGAPGAGKTGAMILLLLEALRYRQRVPESARANVPVPVWLTLGSWNPGVQGLRDWVTATMSRDHSYLWATDFGPSAVAQLFDTGRIALFLDGLDEMPDALRSKAVERLTMEAAGRRLVISSRPDEFRETIDLGHRQLPYTAVIELRPVAPRAAAGYLLEGQIGAARLGWQTVTDHLLADPDGVLARGLNTPLTLSLARAAYTSDDPRGLLASTLTDEHELRVQLLDQILVAAYPDARVRTHATYWLGWLAHKMATQPSGPIRDLRWWQIPSWTPRWRIALTGALIGGLSVSVGLCLVILITEVALGDVADLVFDLLGGLASGLFGAVAVVLFGVVGITAVTPRSMAVRWPRRQDLRSVGSMVIRAGIAFILVFGVFLLLAETDWTGFGVAAAVGLVIVLALIGMAGGLLIGVPLGLVDLWLKPLAAASDVTPRLVHRRDVRSHVVSGLMGGVVGGMVGGLLGLLSSSGELLRERLVSVLELGLTLALMFGVVNGLVSGLRAGAAPSLLFAELALLQRGRRMRFMALLESALDKQVLRQAGAVYQFRHAELQDRLADRYKAGLMPRPTAQKHD